MIRKLLLILAVAAVPMAFMTIQIVQAAKVVGQHSQLEAQAYQFRQQQQNARAEQLDQQAETAAVTAGTHLFMALVSFGVAVYMGTRKPSPAPPTQ
jgi:hypothetical protein